MDNFPYAHTYLKISPKELMDNIITCGYVDIKRDIKHKFPIELVKTADSYLRGDIIVNLFTEEVRMKANVQGYKSPIEEWKDSGAHRCIMKKANKLLNVNVPSLIVDTSVYAIREAIYTLCKEANAFSAVISKAIYDIFLPTDHENHVFDPFGGWGDRMIGALCSDVVTTYTCVDSNPDLESAYKRISAYDTGKIRYHISEILSFLSDTKDGDDSVQYDLIFTSPPYYNYEIYTTHDDPTQSTYEKKSYQDWFNSFMFPLLKLLFNILRRDRYMLIHAGNTKGAPTFVTDIRVACISIGLEFIQYIHCRGKESKRSVPILVFYKK